MPGAPTLTNISPPIGSTMGGETVTLTGTNFRKGMIVTFNGLSTVSTVDSDTTITATTPSSPGSCGFATVTVQESSAVMVQRADLFRYRLNNISFTPVSVTSNLDTNATALGVFKLNSDSIPDFILANSASNNVTIAVASADMSFPSPFNRTLGENHTDLIIGDVNNDSKEDVILFNPANALIRTMINDGTGGLSITAFTALNNRASAMALGNFYEQGAQADLAFIDETSSRTLILAQNAGTGFSGMTTLVSTDDPRKVLSGDFNKDGHADIATILNIQAKLRIFLGRGDGTFSSVVDYSTGGGPTLLASGDVNGDGITDLFTANSVDSSLSVAIGAADGSFTTGQLAGFTVPSAKQLLAADLNCDALVDLGTYTMGATVLGLAINSTASSGSPAFNERPTVTVSDRTLQILFTQLDSDGKPDLAILSQSGGTTSVSLLRNTSM